MFRLWLDAEVLILPVYRFILKHWSKNNVSREHYDTAAIIELVFVSLFFFLLLRLLERWRIENEQSVFFLLDPLQEYSDCVYCSGFCH